MYTYTCLFILVIVVYRSSYVETFFLLFCSSKRFSPSVRRTSLVSSPAAASDDSSYGCKSNLALASPSSSAEP